MSSDSDADEFILRNAAMNELLLKQICALAGIPQVHFMTKQSSAASARQQQRETERKFGGARQPAPSRPASEDIIDGDWYEVVPEERRLDPPQGETNAEG